MAQTYPEAIFGVSICSTLVTVANLDCRTCLRMTAHTSSVLPRCPNSRVGVSFQALAISKGRCLVAGGIYQKNKQSFIVYMHNLTWSSR